MIDGVDYSLINTLQASIGCLKPIKIHNKKLDTEQYVRCGKCFLCKKEKAREWLIRLVHHNSTYLYCYFVTLTYSDDNIPSPYPTLRRKDLQDFFKRFRYYFTEPFTYFACGEYGELRGRPHYHILLFTNSEIEFESSLINSWTFGRTQSTVVTDDRAIAYVAGYVQKKLYDTHEYKNMNLYPPFTCCSKGIGLEWCMKNQDKIKERGYITYHGSRYPIPLYYKRKIGIEYDFVDLENSIIRNNNKLGLDFDSDDVRSNFYDCLEKHDSTLLAKAYDAGFLLKNKKSKLH